MASYIKMYTQITPLETYTGTLLPMKTRSLLWELCEYSFRIEFQALDAKAAKRDAGLCVSGTEAQVKMAVAEYKESRRLLLRACFPGGILMPVDHDLRYDGLAAHTRGERYRYLSGLWLVMDTWNGDKPTGWRDHMQGDFDRRLTNFDKWERLLVDHYTQTFYNYFGRAPILPRKP
jgi:hypothetical protein